MTTREIYKQASVLTANNLKKVTQTLSVQQLSRLSLPEIDAVVNLVAQVIPAGNVPGMILSGLTRLPGRHLPLQKVQQDINILFKEVGLFMDQAKYGALFAGPAAIIWGYQNLLKLAGKDIESSFPEGAWQFYADYALREDTARHTNETHGFDSLLRQHDIRLSAVDRLTAWAMASITCLHQFNALLANEWRERVATALLKDVAQTKQGPARFSNIYCIWESRRPYRREADAAAYDYPEYRRHKFDQFLEEALHTIPALAYIEWETKLNEALARDLPAYQRQMSILAYLDPGQYGETRVPFDLTQAQIGIIHQGNYYLLPVCQRDTQLPLDVLIVRAQIASLMKLSASAPSRLTSLARVKRSALTELYDKLNPILQAGLQSLRFAPILLNSDIRTRALPLSELRQTERGVGDHALTIFDTGETFVFDQSHIFFDGAWGAALAEIMTNEALSWAGYLYKLPPAASTDARIYATLALSLNSSDVDAIQQAPHIQPEVGAETDDVDLKACLSLRKQFKQRNDLLQLTINDLLILYRAIHAVSYQPSPALIVELDKLSEVRSDIANTIHQAIKDSRRSSPSILIPIDASQRTPRERLYPMNIEVPIAELDLLNLHVHTVQSLDAYRSANGDRDRSSTYAEFDRVQRLYLASLAGIGAILSKARQIAIQGESVSMGAIKLLAHLHPAIQRLLNKVPERFELLNNIIKGREVFSNIGAVVPTSSLTRFITAKDDNNQKQLAWGVLTDASGIMHINLRDFRPHVSMLLAIGRKDLAALVTRDYLDAYAHGLNAYVRDLSRITIASRQTQPKHGKQKPA